MAAAVPQNANEHFAASEEENDDTASASSSSSSSSSNPSTAENDVASSLTIHNASLEVLQETHAHLMQAVRNAQGRLAKLKAERRFWMEEICANLVESNSSNSGSCCKLPTGSVWRPPIVFKNHGGASSKRSSSSTKAGTKRKGTAGTGKDNSAGRKKSTKTTKATPKKKNLKEAESIPRFSPSGDDNNMDLSSSSDHSEQSYDDPSSRHYASSPARASMSTHATPPSSLSLYKKQQHLHSQRQNDDHDDDDDTDDDDDSDGPPSIPHHAYRYPASPPSPDTAPQQQYPRSESISSVSSTKLHPTPIAMADASHAAPETGNSMSPSSAIVATHHHHHPRNYSSLQDIASDEDDSDEDRF